MGPIKIEEVEGERVGSTDYFFVKIGDAVPLKANDSEFDLKALPSQPLAVSERFRLTFVAHASGFFVVRTKDLIDSAKEFKEKGSGTPVQELSIVDVPFGKVRILVLSTDNSTLAASVSGEIRFYSVDNFLNKEVKQSFSCSLNDSTFVRDMRWITTSDNSFVVLSNIGKLYYGEIGVPLKHVMDNVDAVDWGFKGSFIAVASKSVLRILSAKFEERTSISLSFVSWIGHSTNCSIKVDSVKWVRPDSIVIGCVQLTDDHKEENYLIQVVSSRHGEINGGCSEFVVQSFYDIYQGLMDEIVPFGSGPYLLLTYLKQCQLAINGNTKNTDELIMLLGWSADDGKNEAAVIDIVEDKWIPRIELQENGDNNMLLGLCADNVSIYQKVGVQLGVEEKTELSPCCVLICLTLEGKLVMFHVASVAGSKAPSEVYSALHNDEVTSVNLPEEEPSTVSQGLCKQELDKALEVTGNLAAAKSFGNPSQITCTEDVTKCPEVDLEANSRTLKSNVEKIVPDVDVKQDANSNYNNNNQNPFHQGEQQKNFSPKIATPGPSIGSFTIKGHSTPALSSFNNSRATTEKNGELWTTNSSKDSQIASNSLLGDTFSFPKKSDVSSFSASSYADSVGYQSQKYTMGAANVLGSMGGKPFVVQDLNGVFPGINSASRPVQSGGQLAGNVRPVLDSSLHLSSNENTTARKLSLQKFHPSNEQQGTSSKAWMSNSDISKEFGNINGMTKELDLLLRSIEEAGGFRDACTRALQSSIEVVEQGMHTLSEKCKILMCQVDERHEEVHYLLNKTIRVMARKIYMEDIYKQASDSRYWDLWNRQKLNSELDLKRQHIVNLNKDLTNQLIELERHFNGLELNKFSQYGERCIGHGPFQSRFGSSRYTQSLHRIHNAISSQLVAAKNLSDSLSKQMEAPSLRSQTEEQKNVKELFETIGIPYDAPFVSPDVKGVMKTPPSQNLFSDLATNKGQSRRSHASVMKSCEPETARRRRDSLDRSWTCFEPPKTILKRKLLQELQKPKPNESLFLNKEKNFSMLEESAPRQVDDRFPSLGIPASKTKTSTLDSHLELEGVSRQGFIQADKFRAPPTQVSEPKTTVLPKTNISAIPSQSAFQLSPAMVHGYSTGSKDLVTEKSTVAQKFNLILNSEDKLIPRSNTLQQSLLSAHSTTETPSMPIKYSEMPITQGKITMPPSSIIGDKLSSALSLQSSKKDLTSSQARSSTISAPSTLLGDVYGFNVKKSLSDESTFTGSFKSLSTPDIEISSPLSSFVSSATVPPVVLTISSNNCLTSLNTSTVSNPVMSSSPSPSASLHLPNQAPKDTLSSLPNPPGLKSTLESLKSEIQPSAVSNSKSDSDAATEVVITPNGASELKVELPRKSGPTSERSSNNITSSEHIVVSVSQPQQPSVAPLQLSTSFLTSGVSSGKNEGFDVGISYEDNMEEEAPETSNTTELSLGSLGRFGIGSSPNPSIPKPNPFGVSFNNVATSTPSSTVPFSVPNGELFRPPFTFPSPQSSAPTQSSNPVAFSGGFNAVVDVPAQSSSGFGQPAQIGSGQQALGSVLGSFGQSRQLGSGLPGSGFAAPSGFGGGFAGSRSTSGFLNNVGGFAGKTSTGGGFAGIASTGGGFAGAASTGSGFPGFAGAAPTVGGVSAVSSTGGFAGAGLGGGFGAFSSQGNSGFGAFGGAVGGSKPPELFTQMRK